MSVLSETAPLAVGARRGRVDPSIASVGDYLALMKPRVMSLVVFTALVGMVIAPGHVHPVIALTALICIAVGAGAAGALNMWYDADIDAVMTRTSLRPIPQSRIAPGEALGFGMTLACFSAAVLGLLVNWVAAGLLAFTIFFYVVVYTVWLKRSTPQNIVIGGAAGALPPVIGWAASTGTVSFEPVLLFVIVFVWTPAHFWALALTRVEDYARASVPMLPVVAGRAATTRQVLLYSVLSAVAAVLPWLLGYCSAAYGAAAVLAGAGMVVFAAHLFREKDAIRSRRAALRLFGFSILYLFAVFAFLLVDGIAGRFT